MSFNAGEVAPVLWYRSDLAKYRSSCQRLENYVNMPQGSVRRRYGTSNGFRFSDVSNSDGRVISWEVDRDTYFQMIFLDNYIYFFNSTGGLVETITPTPFTDSQLKEIYYKQVYDVMYLVHPDVPVQELRRTGSTSWTLSEFEFLPPPMGDQNNDNISLTSTLVSGSSYTITASADSFSSNDIDRVIKMDSSADLSDSDNWDDTTVNDTSTPLYATGVVTLRTEGGIWDGVLELQKQVTRGSGSWETIGSITSEDGNHNGEILRDIDTFYTRVRVKMASRGSASAGDTGCKWTLTIDEKQYAYFKITGYTSDTEVTADLFSGDAPTATTNDWYLSAFGGDNGYPTCIEIHEERMMLAGVLGTPATVYGSKINDWANFETGTLATSPVKFTLSADVRNRTRWLSTEKSLIMGTDYGEWSVGSRDGSSALSGENVNAQRQSQYGSDPVQSVTGSDMTLYIEAGGKRVRSMTYNFAEKDGYISTDMNILAPHLTEDSDFVRLAYSRVPEQVIWCLRDDGLLCAFTYDREQQVTAWSRHPMNGSVLDMNSFLTDEGDVINLLVKRSDGIYFETIKPNNLCLDWHRQYNMESDYVASINGDESFTIYEDSLAPSAQVKQSNGSSSYIRIINPPTDLVVKYNGVIIDNDELVNLGNNMYWLSTATDKTLITVFDFTTELVLNTDYELFNTAETQCVQLLSGAVDMSTVSLYVGATPLTENEDYFKLNDIDQMLIIGETGTITPQIGVDPLSTDVYTTFIPSQNFASESDIVHVGIPYDSILETTEITNSPQSGGAGNTARVNQVDVFIVDGVGGEVSTDGGNNFEPILFTSKTTTAGERLPAFTGKKEVSIFQGYTDDQTITIRNNTAYNHKIASIGAHSKGYSE